MAFKASTSRAPASPAVYKIEANKLFGIDASTSDDNVSLGRACGISYFNAENGGEAAPGLCNFIRTNYGEIGKRRGAKTVLSTMRANIANIEKAVAIDNLIILCTVDSDFNAVHSNFWYALHFLVYDNGQYNDTTIKLGTADMDSAYPFGFVSATPEKVIIFVENGIIFLNTKDISSGNFASTIKVSSAGVQFFDVSESAFMGAEDSVERWEYAKIKIPTVYIGASAAGGSGKSYEPANILNPWVCEMFQGDGISTDFTFSFEPLKIEGTVVSATVQIKVLNDSGVWENVTNGTTWNENKIHFEIAPGKPTVEGEDNVMIVYRRADWDMSQIANCNIYCNFGVGGYKDRLFVSGNEDYPNYVWYSDMDDYTYFPDTSYLTFSDGNSEVKALAGQDTSLAVITDDKCYLVSGAVNTSEAYEYNPDALFLISHVFESAKPAGFQKPLVFNNEIVYMSEYGLAAITPSNVMDERYTQIRSDRAGEHLLNENLEELQCCVCGDFFVINNGAGRMYLLDGAQFSSSESKPFSYRQYETFVWELQAEHIWNMQGELHFIYKNIIYRVPFGVGAEDEDYTDALVIGDEITHAPVKCYWETPNIYGTDFYIRKSFSKLGVLIRKIISKTDNHEINTSVRVYAKKNNEPWKLIKDYDGEQSIFRYDYMNYARFSYRNVGKKYSIDKKIKFKKTYNIKLRFENDIVGMPLYLQAFSLEYSK